MGGGGGGGGMIFLKYFSLSYMYNTKIDHFSPPPKRRTFIEIGNQMQNYKIEANSELIYEDGSI